MELDTMMMGGLFVTQRRRSHSRIDILKVDIKRWGFSLFESWPDLHTHPESENTLLPMQIIVEVYREKGKMSIVFCFEKKFYISNAV
jgi:hypothetical protein